MVNKKSNPWKIIIPLSIIVMAVIVGTVILSKPVLTYKTSVHQSLNDINQDNARFYPWQLAGVLNNNKNNIVLFDIRNDYEYARGHIPGAENVPASDLTRKNFLKRMKKLKENNTTVVLYGKNQLQANGPWMFFRQVGFNNVKILLGGYDYYLNHKHDLAATKNDSTFIEEVPEYDFAKMAGPKEGSQVNVQTETKPVHIKRRRKTTVVQGGC